MVLTPSQMIRLETPCPDFSLPDTDGTTVSRSDFDGKPLLVMFICNHCPYVKHIAPVLGEVARNIQSKGVSVVAVNSNDVENYPDDSPDAMAHEKRERGYEFPYLFDETQAVAKAFHAACTPDFFLYDDGHHLVYRGQFDATRPDKGTPTGESLLAAVDALVGGDAIPEQSPSVGCNIKWKPGNEPA